MKKILSLLFIASIALSCTDDDIKAEANLAGGDKVVGFTPSFQTVSYFADEGVVQRSFPLDLIGKGNGQYSTTDIDVAYAIDYAASTAVEGVEFDFVGSQGSTGLITIPAGSSFGQFTIDVNTGNLDPLQKTELFLDLVSSPSGSVIGQQYSRLRIIFVGCLSNITTAGLTASYTCVIERNDGAVWTRPTETVVLTDINTFKTRTTGGWAAGTIAADQGYNFIDICGDITVPEQGLCQGTYSNLVYGLTDDGTDGLVADFSTGDDFEITYEITFAAGNSSYTNTYSRN